MPELDGWTAFREADSGTGKRTFFWASGASFGYLEEECQKRSFERRCSAVDGEPEGKRSFSPTGRQRLGRRGDRGNPVQNNEPAPPAKDGPEETGYGRSSPE